MLTEEEILEVLNEWNYWERDFENFVERERYMEKIKRARNSGEIIVFTGIRRSGKSTLMKQEMKKLSKNYKKKQFLYVNFEDSRFVGNLNTNLLQKIVDVYRKEINLDEEMFLFFDEIQEVEGWEKFVRTFYDLKKAKIYLTGSSSKMLSAELSTSIAGRFIEIKIFPLTFKEFLKFKNIDFSSKTKILGQKTKIKKFFDEFVRFGGFPRVVLSEKEVKKDILMNYIDTILMKDILGRYNLKNSDVLKKVTHIISTNDTKLTNINSLAKTLGIRYETCANYISYLKETYFLYELKNFNFSIQKQIKSNSKFYNIDTGIINSTSFRFKEERGGLLENIVLNYLVRNLNEVYYFNKKNECDFVAKKGKKINELIQVCYNINKDNRKREINGLLEAMEEFKLKKGIILTYDQEEEIKIENKKIRVIPAWKWMLSK